jgi:fumarate reductase (CoM/CoB) subunit B
MAEEAKNMLLRNISIFEAAGVSQVVTACPDCSFAFTNDYVRLVGDGNRKPRFEVSDVISLLTSLPGNTMGKIACHNPCYLSKQGIRLSDELAKKGFAIEEVIDDCCGAGGGVYFTNPEIAAEISGKAVKNMQSNILVTGCPFCKEQFEKVVGDKKRLIHYLDAFG